MKKIYLLMTVLVFAIPFSIFAQENMVYNPGFEEWDDPSTPTGWDKYDNIAQESTNVHSGTFSAAQTAPNSSSKKLRQNIPGVVPGMEYTVSFWLLDNDQNAKCRIYSYFLTADGTRIEDDSANFDKIRPNVYIPENSEWQQYVVQVVAPENAAKFRFEVRSYKGESGTGGGVVYFDDFYFGTEEIVLPEPSNYPTDFTATTNKLFIDLTWTDATGEQLPSGYLIYGAKEGVDIPVPVDGEFVLDDPDWSDGLAAGNVPFGMMYARVDGLEPGETYHFAIYPYTNGGGTNVNYKTDGTAPTASATTENIQMLNFADFESGEFEIWHPVNVTGEQEWYISQYNGNSFAKISGYSSGNHANEDWLISDPITIDADRSAFLDFRNAYKYDGNPLELLISTDYDGSGNPNGFTWTDLTGQATWSDGNYNWVSSGDIDISDYAGQTVYIAFKYTSTDDASSTWELDDIFVYESIATGIINKDKVELNIYPNPVVESFNVKSNDDGIISIIDLTGKTVYNGIITKGVNNIKVKNLHSGVYIVNVKTNDGIYKSSKLTVK